MNQENATTTAPSADSLAGLLRALEDFTGSRRDFEQRLLALQCQLVTAEGAALLEPVEVAGARIRATYPPLPEGHVPPRWLTQVVEHLAKEAWPTGLQVHNVETLSGSDEPPLFLLLFPVPQLEARRTIALYALRANSVRELRLPGLLLELSCTLLATCHLREQMGQREEDLAGLTRILQLLRATNEQEHFRPLAMALCNELTVRYGLERASLGLLRGTSVRLVAMSQTEHLHRRMNLVQQIEAAMEECLDQDGELLWPTPADMALATRQTGELAQTPGSGAVCSLPIRRHDNACAVLTCERTADKPFTLAQVQELRIAADLLSARLLERWEQDRWLGARVAASCRRGLALALGPQHTWYKVAAALVFAALLFMIFVQGPDRVDGRFTVETLTRQIVPAPYDAFIEAVFVEPGDQVHGGLSVLATLDTRTMQAQLAQLQAQWDTHRTQADIARMERNEAQVQIAQARARQVQSQMDLLALQIAQARLLPLMDGVVLAGEFKSLLGAPVARGDVLFEIAPIDQLRAELHVPDHRIAAVHAGQRGTLATSSHPDQPLDFVVEQIHPVAEVIHQRNVFRVKVRLEQTQPWIRPGVEGLARIDVGRRPYGVIWTRDAWNWLRMQLWI